MFVHQMRGAAIAEDGMRDFDLLLTDLPDGFKRVLAPARLYVASLLGIPESLTEKVPAVGRRLGEGLRRAEIIASDANLLKFRSYAAAAAQAASMARICSAVG